MGNGLFSLLNFLFLAYLKKYIFVKQGQTGYPWIDACMRQLRQEGWIHHVCRNSVAVFLTRGDLFLSWERGMKVFLRYQIDVSFKTKKTKNHLNKFC
jgi:hypothetical protein